MYFVLCRFILSSLVVLLFMTLIFTNSTEIQVIGLSSASQRYLIQILKYFTFHIMKDYFERSNRNININSTKINFLQVPKGCLVNENMALNFHT